MISTAKKRELNVLFYLSQNDCSSLVSLSQNFNISQRLVKESIINITANRSYHLGVNKFIYSDYNGKIFIPRKKEAIHYFCRLKLIYLNESIKFQLLVLLSTHHNLSRNKILSALFISDSYLTKVIRNLNNSLKKYGFSISTKNRNISFIGNEVSIRLFIYLFLSDTHKNMKGSFNQRIPMNTLENSSQKNTANNFHSPHVHTSLCTLVMILSIRKNNTLSLFLPNSMTYFIRYFKSMIL